MNNLPLHRDLLTDDQKDVKQWPQIDKSKLSEGDRGTFERRLAAVTAYLAGATHREIQQQYGISPAELRHYLSRCLARHADGRIFGQRALVPHARVKTYERRAPIRLRLWGARGGLSGALSRLFEAYPAIKEFVDDVFLKRRRRGVVHESRIPIKSVHKRFLDKCREAGLSNEYPFNTKWLGKRALGKYLQKLARQEAESSQAAREGSNAGRRLNASKNEGKSIADRPFKIVQCDAHRIDAIFTLRVTHPQFGEYVVELPRIWILIVKEVATRAILGHLIVLSLECTARDLARAIRNAVRPWKPKTLTIPGLKYPPGGGFPSGLIPTAAWAAWDSFWYDNAKAHLAQLTTTLLLEKLNCRAHAGAVGMIERRAIMERFFGTLEENGFHRLPSTTGSHPSDPRRNKPDKQALRYDIRLEHLEELTEVMLAQFNATPHASLAYRTPVEALEYYLTTGGELRHVAEEDRDENIFLYELAKRTVRGNLKHSRHPYIEYEGAIYRSEVLTRSFDLIGRKLDLHVNPDDLSCIKAFYDDGVELGVLTAQGAWGRASHSLETRRAIQSLCHRKLIAYTEMDDPVQVYMDYLATQSVQKRRERTRYGKVQREMEKSLASEAIRKPEPEVRDESQPAQPSAPRARRTITY